jgi:hypothetical protein
MFADSKAGHRGRNRFEFAANLRRRVRLEVEGILMRRPPGQVDHDHRFSSGTDFGRSLGLEQLRQHDPAHSQRADAQEIPA